MFDHMLSKQQAVRLSADAACTVLRVDQVRFVCAGSLFLVLLCCLCLSFLRTVFAQIIMSKPAGGPAPRKPGPMDAGDA